MDWIEVFIETSIEGLEIVSGLLYQCGLKGLMINDPQDFAEFLEDENRTWDYIDDGLVDEKSNEQAGITFFVSDNMIGNETLSTVKSSLSDLKQREKEFNLGSLEMTIKNVKEDDWANNWKKYFKPLPVGEKLIIKPTWEELKEDMGKIVLKIDPGRIFGTGTHETTQLCIEHIENHIKNGDKVIDIGCGSGILSIASLLLGASYADAVDIDPSAIDIAYENAEINNISKDRYKVYAGNLLEDEKLDKNFEKESYDVVEANIVADVIIAFLPKVITYIKNNGVFICSGIIKEREEDVINALHDYNFEIIEVKRKGEWVAIASRYKG